MHQEMTAGPDLLDDIQRERIVGYWKPLNRMLDHTGDLAVQNQLSIIERDATFEHP